MKDSFLRTIGSFFIHQHETEKAEKDLSQKVQKLTTRLAEVQKELEHARKVSEAKSRYLANMSHEIRTPLSGIVGLTSLLKEDDLPENQRELFRLLAGSADALMNVLNGVLDLSKIEEGKFELDSQDFVASEITKGIQSLFEYQIEEKNITFVERLSFPENVAFVSDLQRIRQVLINLISNALKFTSDGGAVILQGWIEESSKEGKALLRFAVSDTGIGISEERVDKIFEAYVQTERARSRLQTGTGLGLSLAKQFVQLLGGEIFVASRPTVGSCFHFVLELPVIEKCVHSTEVASLHWIPPEERHVLVVEDNLVNQKLIQKLLEKVGYQVSIAENGQVAVDLFRQEKFDIILMDVQMPVMDGLEATRIIREECGEWGKQIPIIGISAHAFRDDAERSRITGMNRYITKPFKNEELLHAMNDAFTDLSTGQLIPSSQMGSENHHVL